MLCVIYCRMGKRRESCLFLCLWASVFLVSLALLGTFLMKFLGGSRNFGSVLSWDVRHANLDTNRRIAWKREEGCTYSLCFDVYRCMQESMGVYLYPLTQFSDGNLGHALNPDPSREFLELRKAVRSSKYFERDPKKACLFFPGIDTLNQNRISGRFLGKLLASLDHWGDGSNHLLFNMIPGSVPEYNNSLDGDTGRAMIAGGGFNSVSFRRGFDVSIPVWNPLTKDFKVSQDRFQEGAEEFQRTLLIANVAFAHKSYKKVLTEISRQKDADRKLLTLDSCSLQQKHERFGTLCGFGPSEHEHFPYPQVLERGEFCLILESSRLGQTLLSDAIQTGCVPVIVSDDLQLPFSEVLDWKRASLQLYNHQLPRILDILQEIPREELRRMQIQLKHFWSSYFKNMTTITLTTLRILEDRVYPHTGIFHKLPKTLTDNSLRS